MKTIHVSETDAAGDFPGLLARVRSGTEVVIDRDTSPPVVLRVLQTPSTRRLSESLRMARESSSAARLDADFSADLEAAVNSHREPLENSWE